ncbi:MAG: hypothetical protein IKV64_05060, partial [Clostridia bacterium]|nr:hypothetical protein [Clostridia bacterium]
MYRKYFFWDVKVYIIVCAVILISVFSGCLCNIETSANTEVKEYLTNFLLNIEKIDKFNVSLSNLAEMLFVFFVIFISAFLRFGFLINYFVVFRRAFVIGYTLTAFISSFGNKGLLAVFAILPEIIAY